MSMNRPFGVAAIHAQVLPARLERRVRWPGHSAIRRNLPPFRMGLPGQLIPHDGGIDRRANAGLVAGRQHLAQQIALELRVRRADCGRVIAQAVVALGEDCDRVDTRGLERAHELGRVEIGADAGDIRRGMEIEVNLAGSEGGHHASFPCTGGSANQLRDINVIPRGYYTASAIEPVPLTKLSSTLPKLQ